MLLPADYPTQLTENWTLPDGEAATLRAIRPDDLSIETTFAGSLSGDAAYRRLLSPRRPQIDELRHFTRVDHRASIDAMSHQHQPRNTP